VHPDTEVIAVIGDAVRLYEFHPAGAMAANSPLKTAAARSVAVRAYEAALDGATTSEAPAKAQRVRHTFSTGRENLLDRTGR
jgi:hypothetical protein